MSDIYRKPTNPDEAKAPRPKSWPFEKLGKHGDPRPPDAIDRTIENFVAASERGVRVEAIASAVLFFLVLVIGMGVVAGLYVYDENARTDCVRRGGHVEEVHGARTGTFTSAWVCIGEPDDW